MKKVALLAVFAAAGLMAADGAELYKPCAGCHGAAGEKKGLGKSELIKGWDAAKTEEALKGYKAGTLNKYGMGAMMKGQVTKLSDEDIKAVSAYVAGLK